MFNINKARANCAAAISQYYKHFGLLADMLESGGSYRSYWRARGDITLESLCDNIFDPLSEICVYELQYIPSVSSNSYAIQS